ncbi:Putative transmembrane protein OS=Castellaniella defragrans (strain DSM / CCUG 39792 / 65Phen)OX=1437824 GN=BN940_07096 PE=4 SV=1 [Castellaniella denitrificans]|uniref:DUF924 family protein n=1 Tax=Castellaniella sp. TaxID=1955812 RepID=UPI002AFFCCA9|nr:DUF924 family protein [Castellaniella sp.]
MAHAAPTVPSAAPEPARAVVAFWREAGPGRWFSKDAAFDAEFRERFMDVHFAAARGELEDWLAHPESALALILLLDQYPRNAFRGTGHMFATDGLALACARRALAFLDRIEPALRGFVCLPFMHAEDLAVQEESVALYEREVPGSLHWAVEHRDVVRRFGRFPHRNRPLGRDPTPEERRFLDTGGFAG